MSMRPPFVDRDAELAALDRFWSSGRAQCVVVAGRRRVGKTFLLEHFASEKRSVYFRCQLRDTAGQLAHLGEALAAIVDDPVIRAEPPTGWDGVLALVERLCQGARLLFVLDELPYWAARDERLSSVLQNWWDATGRYLDLMLVLCGSAAQMMERLLTGDAPLAGCVTGRVPVRPFDHRAAATLLGIADPIEALSVYGVLGGVPLYLSLYESDRGLRENLRDVIASPNSRLYVEPQALFAAHHTTFDAQQALATLRTIAHGEQSWSEIINRTKVSPSHLARLFELLAGDLALVAKVTPVTEKVGRQPSRPRYVLADNFLKFWFRFIEPNQGSLEFGRIDPVVDQILEELDAYMGPVFEEMCREWVGQRFSDVARVGGWWGPAHDIDLVGVDREGQVSVVGECKWRNRPVHMDAISTFLDHLAAMRRELGDGVRPDVQHVICSKSGFDQRVADWSRATGAMLITPQDILQGVEGVG
jgi:hypothetical protein